MTVLQQETLDAICRSYFLFFLKKVFEHLHPGEPPLALGWYLRAMCHSLMAVRDGSNRRLVITVPPRHLKSITTSVAFVAWCLGHDPTTKIIVASYSADLARRHAEQCRSILESDWYRRMFPGTRISERGNRQLELVTTRGGYRKAVSVGGSVTGHGADLIIVDDLMKADDVHSEAAREEARRWFDGSLLSRLNDKRTGAIISIQQRLHEDDLPAHLLDRRYKHLNLPAIGEVLEEIPISHSDVHVRKPGDLLNPDREDQAVLDQLRIEMGPQNFSAQYQQEPIAPEGNLIRIDWFPRYGETPERPKYRKVVQSWDTAMSSDGNADYSVCTTWGLRGDRWWLIDVFRQRLDFPDLKRAAINQARLWSPDKILIEDAGSGKSLAQDLRTSGPLRPILIKPRGDKDSRVIGQTGRMEAGYFMLPQHAPWLSALVSELKAFPYGRHDDQVDSMIQFTRWEQHNWRWGLETRGEDGRLREPIRLRHRPPLRPLSVPLGEPSPA